MIFNKIATPSGKTEAVMIHREHQCDLEVGDKGYVDGYVTAADNRPYAVFACVSGRGVLTLNLVSLHCLSLVER